MNHNQSTVLAASIMIGAGAIAFTVGDLASATQFQHNSGKAIGAAVAIFGVLMLVKGLLPGGRARGDG